MTIEIEKITPGTWEVHRGEDYIHIYGGEYNNSSCPIADIRGGDDPNADADLMAEAGTVANETGLTPRQLADQRKELLEALKDLVRYGDLDSKVKAQRAIAKAEGKKG